MRDLNTIKYIANKFPLKAQITHYDDEVCHLDYEEFYPLKIKEVGDDVIITYHVGDAIIKRDSFELKGITSKWMLVSFVGNEIDMHEFVHCLKNITSNLSHKIDGSLKIFSKELIS